MSGRAALAVIEGFYGPPWSHEARRSVLRFAARCGFSAYLWAPKSHPAHRARWSEPPSAEHVARTAELAREATGLGMRWIYGLSPAVHVAGVARDADRVARRLAPLQASGVRSFAIAFDDTWPTLLPRLASREAGRAHGALAADVAATLRAADPHVEVLVVPAIYAGRVEDLPRGGLDYLRGLAERAAELPAAWTGPRIFSPWIRGSDVRAVAAATGLRPWVWSNATTNDWLPLVGGEPLGRAATERLPGAWPDALAADVLDATPLIALNGAREADMTRPALWCLGAWARDPIRHDAQASFARGVEEAFGPRAAAALAPLLAATRRHALAAPARRDLPALEDAVAWVVASELRAPASRAAARDRAEKALNELARAPEVLAEALVDQVPLALEVSGTARKLAALARAGLAGLASLRALDGGDARGSARAIAEASAMLRSARRIRWDVDPSPFLRLVAVARAARRGRSPLLP